VSPQVSLSQLEGCAGGPLRAIVTGAGRLDWDSSMQRLSVLVMQLTSATDRARAAIMNNTFCLGIAVVIVSLPLTPVPTIDSVERPRSHIRPD
jgi:hypothetical protein